MKLTPEQLTALRIWNAERLGWTVFKYANIQTYRGVPPKFTHPNCPLETNKTPCVKCKDYKHNPSWNGAFCYCRSDNFSASLDVEIPPLDLTTISEVEKVVCRKYDVEIRVTTEQSKRYQFIRFEVFAPMVDDYREVLFEMESGFKHSKLKCWAKALLAVKKWTEKEGK